MLKHVGKFRHGYLPVLSLGFLSLLWLTRQPGTSAFTTIYIDDAIFLNQAVLGDWFVVLQSHNGYLHGIPRVIAMIAALLPLHWAALVFSIGTVVVIFIGMVFTWLSLRNQSGLVGRYSLLIAGVLVVVPIASSETVSNIACIQWYLISVAIVVTALGSPDLWRGWGLTLFLLITALTTPLILVAIPGTVWMALHSRSLGKSFFRSWLPTLGLAIGLVPQFLLLSTNEGFGDTEEVPLFGLTTYETAMEMIGPMPLLAWDTNNGFPWGLPFAALTVVVAVTMALFAIAWLVGVGPDKRKKHFIALAIIGLVLVGLGLFALPFRGAIRAFISSDSGNSEANALTALVLTAITVACWIVVFAGMRFISRYDNVSNREQISRAVLLMIPAVGIVIASLVIRPSVRTLSLGNPGGTRYVLPLAYAIWIVVVLALVVAVLLSLKVQRNWLWSGPIVVLALLTIALSWSNSLGREGAPQWQQALEEACSGVPSGTVVTVPTAPIPWVTSVPCD